MDWSSILGALSIVSTVGMGVLGYYVSGQRDEAQSIRQELRDIENRASDFRERVAREYVPHSRFDETVREISRKLDTIIESVASKADR